MKKYIISVLLLLGCCSMIYGQAITGTVTDSKDGMGLAGATIVVKGTVTGTLAGPDGKFTIQAAANNTLVFSFMGYQTLEVPVGNRNMIDVKLEPMSLTIDEVVIVGYGSQKKVSMTGAVSTLNVGELKQSATVNLTNSLAGRLTGIVALQTSGKPGADASSLYIRGRSTTNTQSPLILVDGIERDFSQIDPNDIENISILKDASSTAVFGVRGANGVILVATKRGTSGGIKFSFSSQQTLQKPTRLAEFLGAYEYATLYNEASVNDGKPKKFTDEDIEHYRLGDDPLGHPDVNYVDQFLKPFSYMSQYNFNLRGGTDFIKYFVSTSYSDQNGIYKFVDDNAYGTSTDSRFSKFQIRANLDMQLTKTTTLSFDISNRNQNQSGPGNDKNIYQTLTQIPPVAFPIFQANGSFGANNTTSYEQTNPMADITKSGYRRNVSNYMDATVKLDQKLDFITKGLSFNGKFTNNSSFAFSRTVGETASLWKLNTDGTLSRVRAESAISVSNSNGPLNRLVQYELTFNYNRFFGKQQITSMVNYNERRVINAANLPNGYRGMAGRVTYSYDQKYLAEFNAGYNGSNQFLKGKRYGFFPAVSIGWNIAKEQFVKMYVPWVNTFKIRTSYGVAGNDQIGGYSYLYVDKYASAVGSIWNTNPNDFFFGETNPGVSGIRESSIGNNNVSWEKAYKQNYGIDASFFGDRVSAVFEYFIENRKDILSVPGDLPNYSGITGLPPGNYGKVRNKGYEIQLDYRSDPKKDFQYSIGGNVSFARNKILDIREAKQKYDYQMLTGHSIGTSNYYVVTGYFQDAADIANSPKQNISSVIPGDFKYQDVNNDGIIDTYDQVASKYTPVPEIVYAINLGVSYRNFNINSMFQGAAHGQVWCVGWGYWEFYNGCKVTTMQLGRWTPETAATATYPRLTLNSDGTNNHQRNTYFYRSLDYLRLKNLELGYDLPKSITRLFNLEQLRVYVTGVNLITWDKMKITDPEQGQQTYGSGYPQQTLYTFGVNITF